jgi:capsular exopolysaccharide synthesis family protein
MAKQKSAATREVEIYLPHLFGALLRKAWLMVLGGMLGAVILFSSTYFFESVQYRSSAMFYVNNRTIHAEDFSVSGVSSADITASQNLVYTYVTILKTRDSIEDIIDYAGVDRSYEEVRDMISTAQVSETEIFRVNVVGSDPVEVQEIACAVAHVLPKRIASVVEGSSAQVVEASVIATARSGPDYQKSGKVGFLAGFLVTMMVVATAYAMDTTVRSGDDITRFYTVSLLSSIPDMTAHDGILHAVRQKTGQEKKALVGSKISFTAMEGYKLLRTKLDFSFTDEAGSHIVGITSAAAGEGKTTTAANLAYNFAALGKRVLLVDCDMRLPSMNEKLPVRRTPGLSEFLSGQRTEAEVLQTCALEEGNQAFHVIAAGRVPPNPMELLGSARMTALLERMRERYDHILLDLPPVGEVGDALTAAKLADGMLLVVQQDKTDRKELDSALQQLNFVDSRILGLVLNKTRERDSHYRKLFVRRSPTSKLRKHIQK